MKAKEWDKKLRADKSVGIEVVHMDVVLNIVADFKSAEKRIKKLERYVKIDDE